MKEKEKLRLTVELVRQPAQSPDLNVLDLGLWNSIQASQRKLPRVHNEFELVRSVQQAFRETKLTVIDSCFVTLQNILKEVRACAGGNKFKTPRKRKYAPPESNDDLAFAESDTETEDEMDTKPAALKEPHYMNVEQADKKQDETVGTVQSLIFCYRSFTRLLHFGRHRRARLHPNTHQGRESRVCGNFSHSGNGA